MSEVYTDRELLQEILRELRESNKKINEIHTRLAVIDSYNVPRIKDELSENETRLTKLESTLKMWAAAFAFIAFAGGILVQQGIKSIWPN